MAVSSDTSEFSEAVCTDEDDIVEDESSSRTYVLSYELWLILAPSRGEVRLAMAALVVSCNDLPSVCSLSLAKY